MSRYPRVRLKWSVTLGSQKSDGQLPYVGLEHVESWTGRYHPSHDADSFSDAGSKHFEAGDVLFGKLRPYLAKAAIPSTSGSCTSELLVMRPSAYDKRYLLYWLLTPQFIDEVDGSTYGAQMPRASWDFIGNVESPLPPLPVQRRIADFLDRKTAAIDALIEKKERLLSLLAEKRSALIHHAVTKGLDPSVPMKDSGVPWIGEIPAHWEVTATKRFARPGRKTFTDGDWIETPYITDEGVRLLQTGNVGLGKFREKGFRYVSLETFHSLRCTEVAPGDVLVCRLDGPVGRACLAPSLGVTMITSVDNAILKTVDHDNRFLVYVLNVRERLDWIGALVQVGGGHRWRISRTMLGDLLLPAPPFREQSEIAQVLDDATSGIDDSSELVRRHVELLREYRQALITAAVTGQLELDPAPTPTP